jgi:hypothetical protein
MRNNRRVRWLWRGRENWEFDYRLRGRGLIEEGGKGGRKDGERKVMYGKWMREEGKGGNG